MNDNLKPLSIDTIESGECKRRIDIALNDAAKDIIERQYVLKPRTVTVKLKVTPKLIGEGRIQPRISSVTSTSYPSDEGAETVGFIKNGKICVNITNPAEPLQDSFLDIEERNS